MWTLHDATRHYTTLFLLIPSGLKRNGRGLVIKSRETEVYFGLEAGFFPYGVLNEGLVYKLGIIVPDKSPRIYEVRWLVTAAD
jgi:hypothetical protein